MKEFTPVRSHIPVNNAKSSSLEVIAVKDMRRNAKLMRSHIPVKNAISHLLEVIPVKDMKRNAKILMSLISKKNLPLRVMF